MNTTASSVIPPVLQPSSSSYYWKLPTEFKENKGLASLGSLQTILLNQKISSCIINLSDVEWADPQPLLCLGLILAESRLKKDQIKINLGSKGIKKSTNKHRVFLKFLSQQGFLTAFGEHVIFVLDSKEHNDIKSLRLDLASEYQQTHFLNADCIHARIHDTSNFHSDPDKLQELVEELLKEAHDRAIESAFGNNPLVRDMLFQKIRKLLFELVLNVSEHSHASDIPAFVGIYARVRGARPINDENAEKDWTKLFNDLPFGQTQFEPNQFSEWLELYICDIGNGLLSDINSWQEPENNPEVVNILRKAKAAENPLESIAVHLFRDALSKHKRRDNERTAVTGLQHLGHILNIGNDYCRIYTQKGSWVGGHFPWQGATYSRRDIREDDKYVQFKPVSGTAYSFSIQPNHHDFSSYKKLWVEPSQQSKNRIITALKTDTNFLMDNVSFFERRTKKNCSIPSEKDILSITPTVVVLRPPRLLSKQDFSNWIHLLNGDSKYGEVWRTKVLVLADLTPFQILTCRKLLLEPDRYMGASFDIYLVSEQWAVLCFVLSSKKSIFEESKGKAKLFLSSASSEQCFSVAQLAILLRQEDSKIFWNVDTSNDEDRLQSFFNHPVDWHDTDDKGHPIKLKRYLDFTHSLAIPEHYRACRRAVRRCLALFPNHKMIAADKLIYSLANDARLGSYTKLEYTSEEAPKIIVGSIAVTTKTVHELAEPNSELIHVMVHGDVEISKNGDSDSLIAMLWISKLPELDAFDRNENSSFPPWLRIPNTPFIAPFGERSISLLRYKKGRNKLLDFNKPYYPRTPEQTYNDFQQLNILKTGHWRYGRRHDLLTINTRLAFHFSFLEKGPLYEWLQEQFENLFTIKPGKSRAASQILIYPSHPFTDTMLDRIRQDKGFDNILPVEGMIPVKLLGTRTVSPILVSPLVEYQIEQKIEKLKKTNNLDDWAGTIFDDGAVSGKHLRELKAFLLSLGAKTVYTITLLDRTGQPSQIKLLKKYFETNKRFWRWDVPALGNRRDCLLCQGIAIAETYANKFSSPRQTERLSEWVEMWRVRDVETEWNSERMLQTSNLTKLNGETLKVTFGVNEEPEIYDSKNQLIPTEEKQLIPTDSTAATAMIMELSRLTTRTDVVLNKASQLERSNPDVAIEMIASQLLLFLDELSQKEQKERFIKLLELIWSRPSITQATALAGLCFTFADRDVIVKVWEYCMDELFPKKEMKNLDVMIATNILCSRYEFATKTTYEFPKGNSDEESHNFIMLGRGVARRTIHEFLVSLCRNPSNHDSISVHSTEIKKRLENIAKLEVTKKEVVLIVFQDMKKIEQIISRLMKQSVTEMSSESLAKLSEYINDFEKSIDLQPFDSSIVKKQVQKLHVFLYGCSDIKTGLIKQVADDFLLNIKDCDDIADLLIDDIRRDVFHKDKWSEIVSRKNNSSPIKRWISADGTNILEPVIKHSKNRDINSKWIFCNDYLKEVLGDIFSNVFHTQLKDPVRTDYSPTKIDFDPPKEIVDPYSKNTSDRTAHLWWRIEEKKHKPYIIFKAINASNQQKISLKQTVSIAMFEAAGGRVGVNVFNKDNQKEYFAETEVRIPCHSLYLKEK